MGSSSNEENGLPVSPGHRGGLSEVQGKERRTQQSYAQPSCHSSLKLVDGLQGTPGTTGVLLEKTA